MGFLSGVKTGFEISPLTEEAIRKQQEGQEDILTKILNASNKVLFAPGLLRQAQMALQPKDPEEINLWGLED
jgi:hypothetical protein